MIVNSIRKERGLMVQNRNIVVCILLSIVTCGIYGLYWLYCMANDVNTVSNTQNGTSGGMVLLLTIVTCGIYGLYWLYQAGAKLDVAHGQSTSNGILYLILGICGLQLVSWALIQSELNKF